MLASVGKSTLMHREARAAWKFVVLPMVLGKLMRSRLQVSGTEIAFSLSDSFLACTVSTLTL